MGPQTLTGIESRALPQGLRLAAYDVSIIKGTHCHRSIAIIGCDLRLLRPSP